MAATVAVAAVNLIVHHCDNDALRRQMEWVLGAAALVAAATATAVTATAAVGLELALMLGGVVGLLVVVTFVVVAGLDLPSLTADHLHGTTKSASRLSGGAAC
jgi:hypothetical protein